MFSKIQIIVFAAAFLAGSVSAQSPAASHPAFLSLSAGNNKVVHPGAKNAVSLVFAIANRSKGPLAVVPGIETPAGWTTLMGAEPFPLARDEVDQWIISVAVPARAVAGMYTVRISAAVMVAGVETIVRDSIQIQVGEKRGLALRLTSHPAYAVSGDSYQIRFLLNNTGNTTARMQMNATSSLSGKLSLGNPARQLAPGESVPVEIVVPGVRLRQSRDEVVELKAIDPADTLAIASASSLVTIVTAPNSRAPLETIPAAVRLRAGSGSGSVSPYEVAGRGALPFDSTEMEFFARGRSASAGVFGERDEYRMGVTHKNYSAHFGDNLFMLSRLTGGGQPGFGASIDAGYKQMAAGAYVQRFRFQPERLSERAAFIRYKPVRLPRLDDISLNAVQRIGGSLAGNILSSSMTAHPFTNVFMEAELAGSERHGTRASAQTVRVVAGEAIHIDVAHTAADRDFAGAARGTQYDYATLTATPFPLISVLASLNFSRVTPQGDSTTSSDTQRVGTLGLSLGQLFSVELRNLAKKRALSASFPEGQRSAIGRLARTFGAASAAVSFERGMVHDSSKSSGKFSQLRFEGGVNGSMGTLSLFSDMFNGYSVGRGESRARTLGGNATANLPARNSVSLLGYLATSSLPVASKYLQLEAQMRHLMDGGSSVALRARIATASAGNGAFERTAYLEYNLPLRIPVGRAKSRGSVQGVVEDDATGRAVRGALVRLGTQAAVTDGKGNVRFSGLPAGEYRISLANDLAISNVAYSGDQVVTIDSLGHEAKRFRVRISSGSKIAASVRQFSRATTSLGAGPDSLVDAGPVEGITVSLVLQKDTLFQTTGADGKVLFEDLPKGAWRMGIIGDAPEAYRYETQSFSVALEGGNKANLEFRMLPKRKSIQIIAGGGEVTSFSSQQRDR